MLSMEQRLLVLASCAALCSSCTVLFPFESHDPLDGEGDGDADAGAKADTGAGGDAGSDAGGGGDAGACPPQAPSCDGETCETPLWLPVGRTFEGDTSGAEDDYRCSLGGDGPDQVFVWEPTQTGLLEVVVTSPSSWASLVYVRGGCASPELAQVRAVMTEGSWSAALQLCVTAGALHNVFIDAYRDYSGPYVLSSTFTACSGCTEGACPE